MNWGYKIVIVSALFMGYIIFLVTKCFQQDVSLVDKHYYKEEIEYQSQIQKIKNANLSNDLSIRYNSKSSEIALQLTNKDKKEIEGKVQLYRPSNNNMDKVIPLDLDSSGIQSISTSRLVKGLWKVKVHWNDGHSDFFKEEVIVL
jgi:nitrogen fixation protein FixH